MSNVPPDYSPERDLITLRNNVCQERFTLDAQTRVKDYVALLESNQKVYAEDYEKLSTTYTAVVQDRDVLRLKLREKELEHELSLVRAELTACAR